MNARDSAALLPADDTVLAAVLAARAPGALQAAWIAAWKDWDDGPAPRVELAVIQTHYKPFSRARLTVEATVYRADGQPSRNRRYYYVQVYASGEEARRRTEAADTGKKFLRSAGPPVFEVADWNAIVWALPNGPRLRQLRSFLQKKGFRRFLQRVQFPDADTLKLRRPRLRRYVPRRRALLYWVPRQQIGPRAYYIKLYAPEAFEAAAANLQRLASVPRDRLGFRVPVPVAIGGNRRAIMVEELAGEPFTRDIPAADQRTFQVVGRAVARLHGSGLEPPARWSPEDELRALQSAMDDVTRALPGLREPITALLVELARTLPSPDVAQLTPIHANLFGDQILLADEDVGLLDWDDFAVGDPLFDLGRLVAHVIFAARDGNLSPAATARALDALLAGYSDQRRLHPVAERLTWYITSGLLMRAKISALRTLDGDWPRRIARAVDDAQDVWQGRSPFLRASADVGR